MVIPKPSKDHKFPQNYRPISLLNTLDKDVEHAVLRQLKDCTERLVVLPDEQHGFSPGLSSMHQLVRVVEYIVEGFNI